MIFSNLKSSLTTKNKNKSSVMRDGGDEDSSLLLSSLKDGYRLY